MVQEVEACPDEKKHTTDKDQEMHDSRVNVPEKAPVEEGIKYGYLDEFPYPFAGIVETLVRLAKHPHLVAFVNRIPDEQNSDYGCSIETDLNE